MSKEKLSHRVVYCSSEDSGHLAHELSFSSSSDNNNNNKGWISSKQSNYPQELGFELLSRSNDCILTQIQLLSHQSKISTKIEVYAGLGSSYETALFKRLGFLTLDSNERSAFQARELKTVFVDQIPSNYVKFKLHKNHINDHNLYNQVGIMLVNFCGYESTNHNQKPALPYAHANSSSSSIDNDGTEVYSYNQYSSPRGNEVKPFGIEVKLDPPILARLTLLADAKKRAIDEEDYITAKAIKQVESDLKELTTALASLDLSKKEAVAAEDFDRAKELKEQGDEIRMQLNQKIMDIRIPNVPLPEPDRPSPFTHRRVPPSSIDTREEESRFTHPTSARVSSAMTQSPVNYRNDHDEKPVGGSPRSNAALSAYKSAPEVAGDGEYADDFSGADETGTPMSGNKSSRIGVPGGSRHFQSDPVHISVDDAVNEGIENEGDGAPQKHSSATHKAFPPGEHPLNGVPNLNLDELPDPDPLTTVSKQIAGQSGIQSYLGEYVTQCLFSRSWMLRDAAITKTQLLLSSEVEGRDEGEDSVTALVAGLTPVIGVCKVGLDDKNLQVNFSAHGLIEHTLGLLERSKVGKSTAAPAMDSLVVLLIDKLSDSNHRVRDSAKRSLAAMSASSSVGPGLVASCALRSLSTKQKTAWRPLQSRLILLTELITQHGVGGQSGLHSDAIMSFMRSSNAFAHSSGEVREAAKDLTIQLQKLVGSAPLESYLEELRPKQKEEYFLSFEAGKKYVLGTDATGKKTQVNTTKPSSAEPKPSSATGSYRYNAQEQLPESVNKQASTSHRPTAYSAMETEALHVCQFCGAGDNHWTEDLLDEHYLSSCPYLAPCPECTQILEIASLPDHLLDECKNKNKYAPCDVTGLAIKKSEMTRWLESSNCSPPPDNCFYCPLCLAAVPDDNEPWRVHLLYDCVGNGRVR